MAPLPTVDRLRAVVEPAPAQVLAAYLFGSFARGTASADSDIDLGLLLAEPPARTLDGRMLDYEAQLEREFSRPVQVVILNDAPPDLAHRVLRDGRVLLDRDRVTRLRWEVHARNMYFDLLPALTSYRKRARARVDAAMTDRALVEKKLAAVVSAVSDLRRLARLELLRHDVREERFIEHTVVNQRIATSSDEDDAR